MSEYKHISVAETSRLQAEGKIVIADIRDENSFNTAHIKGAFHLTNTSLATFMREHDFEQPVVVVCYHGNSSRGAAQYLAEQGFEQVFSMDGGFESWRLQHPVERGDSV